MNNNITKNYEFIDITVAPIVCLLGFAAIVVAIMWKDKSAVTKEIKK
ncbi:MAG: DUF3098 domain-containing protein [Sphingobacteriaceae bacterium]|nr:DUF3098 domain-containing protein [Sphingobacteriaceae bacterium]